jgi:peptide/nickel transport system substrate-binding protein
MRKLFVFALVAMLAAAGLGFAGGEEETSAAAAMSDGGPVYGGTFTLAPRWGNKPGSPDPADGNLGRTWYHELIQETPMIGDFDTYGPRGSGDFDFKLIGAIPMKYIKGNLIDSWEVDQSKITWRVKSGIYWAPTEAQSAWMDAREFTAEDLAADLRHWATGPEGARLLANKDANIYAEGDTVIIEFAAFDFILNATLGLSRAGFVGPPEMLEDGRIARWEDQVGTGPFMFAEYVPDQFFRMVKNPNYRGTTMVDGEEYQLPFLDEFIIPLANDESFEEAALRTGIADGGPSVYGTHWETLDRTAPDLIQDRLPISFGGTFAFNTEKPPFDNRDVRRAMMVGTDLTGFQKLRQAGDLELPTHWFPVDPIMPSYTPMDELPEETRMLYDYDPEKAKQMLADAGYPNGFTIDYTTLGWPEFMTDGALLKDQWEKIGVTVNLQGFEAAVWSAHARERTYTGSVRQGHCGGCPMTVLPRFTTGHTRNYTDWSDPHFDAIVEKLVKELDPDTRNELIKEASIYLLNEVIAVPQAVKVQGRFWWPWIQNYYGETYLASTNTWLEPSAWVWIDQNLKKEMGY